MSQLPGLPFPTQTPTFEGDIYAFQAPGDLMSSTALSFQADEETVQTLDQLAGVTGRDRQYHLQRAVSHYLEAEMRQMQAVSDGIADADAGNLTDIGSVKARWVRRADNSPD
jgi:predicted transcriptional regulator